MPSGDAQRTWFPEMVVRLRAEWHAGLSMPALINLRDELESMLHLIRDGRNTRDGKSMGNIPQATPGEHRRKSLGGSHGRLRTLKIAGGFSYAEAKIRFPPEHNRSDDSGGMIGPARQLCRNAGGGNRIACGSQCPPTGLMGT